MKIKALLYCTKAKPQLVKHNNGYNLNNLSKCNWELKEYEEVELNGKIVCECEVETEEIIALEFEDYYHLKKSHIGDKELMKRSCLELYDLIDYLGVNDRDNPKAIQKVGYALHISNIKVFDKPRELSLYSSSSEEYRPIKKAPQNMCNAYYDEGTKHYILISVRPQWLCKILNKRKDIEVRRKVLKGMCD